MPKTLLEGKDVLSGALKPVSFQGKVYCVSELTAPWAVSFPKKNDALFHVIEKGKCYFMDAEGARELNEGDLLFLPNGAPHVMGDRPDTLSIPFLRLLRGLKGPTPFVQYGGGGQTTLMACGTFELEAGRDNELLRLLPEVLHLPAASISDKWVAGAIDLLAQEARNYGDGSALVISGLMNVIFIQAIRVWLQGQPKSRMGLLGALQDQRIAAAIIAIHKQPQKEWGVGMLARIAGMSRSSFASQFSSLVGQPPLSYVSSWRMQMAAQLLRKQKKMSLSEVSDKVGYQSQPAFSKAFKRHHGVSPSQFRLQ